MKKLIFIIPALVIGLATGMAQEENDSSKVIQSDTTKIKLGKKTMVVFDSDPADTIFDIDFTNFEEEEKDDDNWRGYFDLGTVGYLTPDNNLTMDDGNWDLDYTSSHSISFYSMYEGFDIIKDRLYITAGMGISWDSYSFRNDVKVSTTNGATELISDTIVNYSKNKLNTTFIQIPVVIGTRIGNLNKNPMSLHVGAIAGYNIGANTKQKYTLDDSKTKSKVKDNYNINPFKVEAIARLTIGNVGIYGRYSVTSLFEKNKATELYPFSVGLTFGDFKKLK